MTTQSIKLAIHDAPLPAGVADHLRIMAVSGERIGLRITLPKTSKSTKLSLRGVISVSAIEWASRVR